MPVHSAKAASLAATLTFLLGCCILNGDVFAAPAAQALSAHLQERFGLNERQVNGALGALLVFVRERLPKTEFDDLARHMPNADQIMQDVKLQGIVTGPLDDRDEYEAALSSLGISQPVASQIAPAVLDWLQANGFDEERDYLAGALD